MKPVDVIIWGDFPPKTHTGISLINSMVKNILVNGGLYVITVEESFWNYSFFGKTIKYLGSSFKLIRLVLINYVKILYCNIPLSVSGLIKLNSILIILKIISPKTKFIGHLHRGDLKYFSDKSSIRKSILKQCLKKVDIVIVLSHIYINEVLNIHNEVEVIVLGNTSSIEANSLIQHKNYGSNFLCVSNYIRSKGIGDLVEAFKQNELSDLQLEVRGNIYEPNFYKELQGKSTPNIHLNGGVSNSKLSDILNEVDCIVLPSWNEGQPLVILEAMSMGVPIIATNVGDIPNMLGQNYPFLIEPHSVSELRAAILKFHNFPNKNELSKTLFSTYKEKYSNDIFKENVLRIFTY